MAHRTGSKSIKLPVLLIASMFMFICTAVTVSGAETLTDTQIANAVDDELMDDSAVPASNIDVSCKLGIVTLSGSVGNILAKDRAQKLAATIKGVRGVVNRIEVIAPHRSNQEIREDVKDALKWNAATQEWEIRVTVDQQVVTLNGSLDSRQEEQLAVKVAKGVSGVKEVHNKLKVDYDTRPEAEIKAEIEQALQWDAYVDDSLINVKVEEGVVTLSGTVGSLAEKREAGDEAWVAGVSDVENKLDVESWAREERFRKDKYVDMSDEEIKDAISDAFVYDPRLKGFKIWVETDEGYVTLRGTVDNLEAKRAAARDARSVVGVWGVDNRIKVRPGTPSDATIEKRIQDALKWDPYVERYQIGVSVFNGEVYLYGDVDSSFEKAQAEDVAAQQYGVREVKNFLMVNKSEDIYEAYADDRYPYDYDWYPAKERTTTKTDWEIKKAVEKELMWSPYINSDEVNVEVDNGHVKLTGTVETWRERAAATESALEGGAVSVANDLDVTYGPTYYNP